MADETPTPTPTPPAPAASTPDADQLGDAGKAALDAERKARRDADKALRDAQAQLKAYEDRDKTDTQKAVDDLASARAERDAALAEAARYKAAVDNGLSADDMALLDGIPADQVPERAKKLAARLAPAKPPAAPPASGQGNTGAPLNTGRSTATAGVDILRDAYAKKTKTD